MLNSNPISLKNRFNQLHDIGLAVSLMSCLDLRKTSMEICAYCLRDSGYLD